MRKMNIMPIVSPVQLEQLSPWLASFDHKPATPIGKFHLFTKAERILALTQQLAINVLVPAVNPHICTPRETTEIVDCFHAWEKNKEGGMSVVVPYESHMHEKMKKLGYQPRCILYDPIEHSPQQ